MVEYFMVKILDENDGILEKHKFPTFPEECDLRELMDAEGAAGCEIVKRYEKIPFA